MVASWSYNKRDELLGAVLQRAAAAHHLLQQRSSNDLILAIPLIYKFHIYTIHIQRLTVFKRKQQTNAEDW